MNKYFVFFFLCLFLRARRSQHTRAKYKQIICFFLTYFSCIPLILNNLVFRIRHLRAPTIIRLAFQLNPLLCCSCRFYSNLNRS